jgi:hypothetical protein
MSNTPLIILSTLSLALDCIAATPQFSIGKKIEADGKPIDISVGHLVPVVSDWNGDGKKDLLVGYFSGGGIRLYLNEGTDAAPKFSKYLTLQAGGKPIRLDAG